MAKLSILCVTQAEQHAWAFLSLMDALAVCCGAEFVIAADGPEATARVVESALAARVVPVRSQGYLESVLEEAVAACQGEYILRLDDDEQCSPAMSMWLIAEEHRACDHWTFTRMNLWDGGVLMLPQLYPDYQTRLSVKAKSGGRRNVHDGSPFGPGVYAPVAIEHHKFLVKSRAERVAIAAKWHMGPMLAYSLPEDVHKTALLAAPGNGLVPWLPEWTREVQL